MLKEILEQLQVVLDTLNAYVNDNQIDFSSIGLNDELLKSLSRIYIVACGSAYHVGLVAKYVIEAYSKVSVEVELASEFIYP